MPGKKRSVKASSAPLFPYTVALLVTRHIEVERRGRSVAAGTSGNDVSGIFRGTFDFVRNGIFARHCANITPSVLTNGSVPDHGA
jgi:hypothetical protein